MAFVKNNRIHPPIKASSIPKIDPFTELTRPKLYPI